jgi:hypothetical protein
MPPNRAKQNRDPINQAVRDARKALEASDVFKALKAAETAQVNRRSRVADARRYLRDVKDRDIALSDEDTALLRKAATNLGCNEIGAAAAIALMSRISEIVRGKASRWRWALPEQGSTNFTPDERRAILSGLHPDNSASSERREAAFKLFTGKVKR